MICVIPSRSNFVSVEMENLCRARLMLGRSRQPPPTAAARLSADDDDK